MVKALAVAARDEKPAVFDVAVPEPGPGQVRVAVRAASVNGIDAVVAAGYLWDRMPHAFPVVLGRDFAGTVLTGDDVVLVSGATGGVGGFAVQLAAATGATVLATARPGDGAAFVRELGARQAVDHTGDLTAAVRAVVPDGVTAVVHAAGDAAALAALLRPGGRLASALGADGGRLGRDDITVTPVMAAAVPQTVPTLLDAVAAGTLRVPVARSYDLDDAAQAVTDFAAHKLGKLIVTIR